MSINTSKEEEREFILQLINTYKNLPILWNTNSRDYFNKQKKCIAYRALLDKYREKYPEAVHDDVKKKFNSLRTNFRKELKRVEHLNTCENSSGHHYEPSLWYYKHMFFLKDMEAPSQSTNNIETEEEGTSNETSAFYDNPVVPVVEQGEYETVTSKCLHNSDEDDDYAKLAAVWAVELRKMNPKQQIFAKKAINNILFEGQMGTLSRHSIEDNIYEIRSSTPCKIYTPENGNGILHSQFGLDLNSRTLSQTNSPSTM